MGAWWEACEQHGQDHAVVRASGIPKAKKLGSKVPNPTTSCGNEPWDTARLLTADNYVARQTDRHPTVDDRVMAQLESLQFHDPAVMLDEGRIGSHGKLVHSLQIVIENAQGWNETRHEVLRGARDMIVRASASKGWRLARIGLLSNHIHILLGCSMVESPESVALSLLNNLAYAQGMTPAFRFSYYAGTFGRYDRNAIRRLIGDR